MVYSLSGKIPHKIEREIKMKSTKEKQNEILNKLLEEVSQEDDSTKRFKLLEQLEMFARSLATFANFHID